MIVPTYMFLTQGPKYLACLARNSLSVSSAIVKSSNFNDVNWHLLPITMTSDFLLLIHSLFLLQCKPDISRLVGSMERYRDISGSAIYRATAMSQNPSQVFQRVVSGDGAFVCLAANSERRQRISWHLSKFDVALQNRVVDFQTKAVCA